MTAAELLDEDEDEPPPLGSFEPEATLVLGPPNTMEVELIFDIAPPAFNDVATFVQLSLKSPLFTATDNFQDDISYA